MGKLVQWDMPGLFNFLSINWHTTKSDGKMGFQTFLRSVAHNKLSLMAISLSSTSFPSTGSPLQNELSPSGRGTVVSIVYCRSTYCCPETSHGKITRHYSLYYSVAFCYMHKCELSYMCPGHDIILHPHRVKLYWIRRVGSGLVLAKAIT